MDDDQLWQAFITRMEVSIKNSADPLGMAYSIANMVRDDLVKIAVEENERRKQARKNG